ncbi:hypothetical protein G7Y89_g12537 [Cudoniella acicularis]|uniref:Uncharacterized protein n=1 Tax=Cudoniella acicularis TaxID=354080 RepID=A0A8H4VWX5_9HELO|nr:hypothetical protein G7Y89_g12537 [Cudoniella acicularis]
MVILSFYPITVFPILQAPRWKRGYSVEVVLVTIVWMLFIAGCLLHRRDTKRAAAKLSLAAEGGSSGDLEVGGVGVVGEKEKEKGGAVHVEVAAVGSKEEL